MENAEEVMHVLEEFSKLKPKDIPRELEDYLRYVAKTGDPVFKWALIKCLFREKLLNVITDFYERTLTIELPPCPNVDPFNYERMKANLLEKLDSFSGAPFTVQRISELLTNPSKEYKRADKFMRAIEKNILVVSIREPGRYVESDSDSQQETSFNGLPGPNDSGIETTFSCNDLADADSSSQSYEINSESQSLLPGVNNVNLAAISFKENEQNIGDSASPNELGIIRNDQVSQEIIIEEKDTETVICSTLSSQGTDDLPQSEIISEVEEVKIELTIPPETSEDVIDSNTPDTNDIIEETKEAIVVEVTAVTESETVVESIQMEEEEVKESSNIVDSSNGSERLGIVGNSNDSSEESSESSSSQTFEESRPAECDTSNSCDSETSNSCDSEVEVKNQEEPPVIQSVEESADVGTVTKAADSTEINEAASTCTEDSEEAKEESVTETTVESVESESVAAESTGMDVGECQISLVDQSHS